MPIIIEMKYIVLLFYLVAVHGLAATSYAKALALFNESSKRSTKESLIILENLIADKKADGKVYALASLIYANYGYSDYKHVSTESIDLLKVSKIYLIEAKNLGEKSAISARAEAFLYMISGKFTESERVLKEAIKTNAIDPGLWYLLACSSEGKLHLPETVAGGYAEKALELNPSYMDLLEDIYVSAIQGEDLVRAEFYYKKLQALPAAKSQLSFYSGMMSLAKGKREEAVNSFEKYLEDNPADARGDSLRREIEELKEP